jgi:tricarballylate dehydrogenase
MAPEVQPRRAAEEDGLIRRSNDPYDVLVVGGGNAGLCAALSAGVAGARVLVLEAAPKGLRGGNSRHTRNLRCAHEGAEDFLTGSYGEPEYWNDLLQVTGGHTSEPLARLVIRQTAGCRRWMGAHGARFQPPLVGTLQLARTNAFFLGGGKALLNAYYRSAERMGVEVEYGAEVRDLAFENRGLVSATVARNGSGELVRARSLVAAAGGFQADLEWLKQIWGEAAGNFLVRGTPYDTGRVLRVLMERGARTIGDPAQCHAVAIDARAPRFDGGIATRVDSIPLGIVVNKRALRFQDEGEDLWPRRYAVWGRLVARQPGQIAYSIVDSKALGAFLPPMFPPVTADSIGELAALLQLDPAALQQTVARFNAAVRPGRFDQEVLDDCATQGLDPPKSHWARALDAPPFLAYPLRPGITFTYFGVAVNDRAQVLLRDGEPLDNVFAAGEIMAGNILGQGYLAGLGMAIGTVFGRIAGEQAARHAGLR